MDAPSIALTERLTSISSDVELPKDLCCPLTGELLRDPVFTCSGHTYEREAIVRHWGDGPPWDPVAELELQSTQLFPDQGMRWRVQEFLDKHPSYTPSTWQIRGLVSLGAAESARSHRISFRSMASTRSHATQHLTSFDLDIPVDLRCPITGSIFRDPVFTCLGNTYDREAICKYWSTGAHRDPLTNLEVESTMLLPNLTVRGLVQEFLEKHTAYTPSDWPARQLATLQGPVEGVPLPAPVSRLTACRNTLLRRDCFIVILVFVFFMVMAGLATVAPKDSISSTTSGPQPASFQTGNAA